MDWFTRVRTPNAHTLTLSRNGWMNCCTELGWGASLHTCVHWTSCRVWSLGLMADTQAFLPTYWLFLVCSIVVGIRGMVNCCMYAEEIRMCALAPWLSNSLCSSWNSVLTCNWRDCRLQTAYQNYRSPAVVSLWYHSWQPCTTPLSN